MRNPTLSDILRDVDVAPQMHDRLARIVYGLGGGTPPFTFSQAVLSNATAATETVVVTTPPFNPGSDASRVLLLFAWSTNAIGTSGTSVQMNIRRGTTVAGVAVPLQPFDVGTVVAGQQFGSCIFAVDTPGAVGAQQYSGTVLVVASAAFSATLAAALVAIAFG